jgi:hypothetical protein
MPAIFKNLALLALSMDNAGFFGLVPLERKKGVAHLLRHPRSKNDPGGEKPL